MEEHCEQVREKETRDCEETMGADPDFFSETSPVIKSESSLKFCKEKISQIIAKKSEEIVQLKKIDNFCSEMLEQPHLDKIRANAFAQPIFDLENSEVSVRGVIAALVPEEFSKISLALPALCTYSSISADYSLVNSMVVNGNQISDSRFHWKSRSLQVSNEQILVTGGSSNPTQVILVNVNTFEIQEVCNLIEGRELHAMAWVDNKPAVIGGILNDLALSTVEVLSTNSWEISQPLTKKRYGLSAITIQNTVWVFGGAESKFSGVLEIEVYSQGNWQIIQQKLPWSIVGIGLVNIGNQVLLLGGMRENGENTSTVIGFNIDTFEFTEKKPLKEPCSFSQNLWKIHCGYVEGQGFNSPAAEYYLE